MDKNQPLAYKALLGLSLLFSLAAVLTLVPFSGAPWPNVLGYKSICPFAPAATAACGLLAGITCLIRSRLVSAQASANRYRPPFVPILVFALLLAIGISATISWVGYKDMAADGSAGPSVQAAR